MPPTKRRRSDVDSDESEDGERAIKSDKVSLKAARMERNRLAAQASRTRQREQARFLQEKVQELESRLGASSPASSSRLASLEQENNALRVQLQAEQELNLVSLARVATLETKFTRLESLLASYCPVATPPILSSTSNNVAGTSSPVLSRNVIDGSAHLVAVGPDIADCDSIFFDSCSFSLPLDAINHITEYDSANLGFDPGCDIGHRLLSPPSESIDPFVPSLSNTDLESVFTEWAIEVEEQAVKAPSFDEDLFALWKFESEKLSVVC